MAKLTKNTLFKPAAPRAETLGDKTTRAVRLILDEEMEKREAKTDRLRKARLEREAFSKPEAPKVKPKAKAAPKAPQS
ncbi:hypothetical protein [Falsiphaeobacter marinintestinus]|uniref:hypothetical protein n=1 Tax=Falsiphaeobacter marinintestinus TaxID=1492905 RepID=UPI0011B36523|nr:hypothetical protein [Phaeobacter marinintestinus]